MIINTEFLEAIILDTIVPKWIFFITNNNKLQLEITDKIIFFWPKSKEWGETYNNLIK